MDRFSETGGGTSRGPATEKIRETVAHEVTEEFALPDYLPEIRKILSCTAEILPENKYVDGATVESSGLAVYSVMYLGDGPELSSAPLQSEYSVTIPVRGGTGSLSSRDVGIMTCCESVLCRATGPRAVAVTAKLATSVLAAGTDDPGPEITAASGGEQAEPSAADLASLEYRRRPVRSSVARFVSTTGDVSGEFEAPSSSGEDGIVEPAVVRCTGTAYVTDAAADGDGLSVKGEVRIRAVTVGSDGKYSTVDSSAPFEERLDPGREFSPAGGEQGGAAFARCASVSVSDAGGGRFAWTAEYDVDGELWETCEDEVVCDAYSVKYGDEVAFGDRDAVRFVGGVNAVFSAGSSAPATAARERAAVASSGRIYGARAEMKDDGTLVFTGNCAVTVTLAGDGTASSEEVTFPVRYERSAPRGAREGGGAVSPDVRFVMKAVSASARIDGGKLYVDAEIALESSVAVRERVRTVDSVTLKKDEPTDEAGGVIRLYYPGEGETKWDIAKRYRVPPESVSGDRPVVIS